ncbi:MAG TPA: universal stress protein [Longimicrobium sp.]|nr:universal stress protein [Longimicrobium sp.]
MQPNSIRSVLAATYLTPASDDVLGGAARLARATDARLHVIHAFDLELSAYPGVEGGAPTFQGRMAQAEERLSAQLGQTVPGGMEAASREIVIYTAHRAILERAAQVRADVIVLGAHRHRGAGLLGTTADRVIRAATCPCLVVRRPLGLPLRRVLVPVDLSAPARGALAEALRWSEALGAADPDLPLARVEVEVVHVMPRALEGAELASVHATVESRLAAQVEAALEGHGSSIPVRDELLWGDDAAAEIGRYAERRDAGLIVMATHGHGAVKRALVGSVASAVARTAPCSVLLVPPALWSGADAGPAGDSAAALA